MSLKSSSGISQSIEYIPRMVRAQRKLSTKICFFLWESWLGPPPNDEEAHKSPGRSRAQARLVKASRHHQPAEPQCRAVSESEEDYSIEIKLGTGETRSQVDPEASAHFNKAVIPAVSPQCGREGSVASTDPRASLSPVGEKPCSGKEGNTDWGLMPESPSSQDWVLYDPGEDGAKEPVLDMPRPVWIKKEVSQLIYDAPGVSGEVLISSSWRY